MIDKKKKLEIVELNEINNLTDTFKDRVFPTRMRGMNTILNIVINGCLLCYLCMDRTPGGVILHLYLPKKNRNTKNINTLVHIFYNQIHTWCRDNGYEQIIVSCSGDDVKTTELFKTFGFEPRTINLAIMPVK